jgi:hypothetical protein
VHIPIYVSLTVILGCMAAGIAWSFVRSNADTREAS